MNGHTSGLASSPHATEQSNSVLSWAYPPMSTPSSKQGPRPGSASKHKHSSHAVSAYGTRDINSSLHCMGAGLCLAGLAGHSVCEGWGAACAAVSDSSGAANVALPLYMTGALKGATGSILAGALYEQTSRRGAIVGASIAVLMPVAALLSLAQHPLHNIHDTFVFDPLSMTDKATAAVAGSLLTLSLHVLMPIASRIHRQSGLKGLLCGAACAGILYAIRGFLCMVSTYCIRPH